MLYGKYEKAHTNSWYTHQIRQTVELLAKHASRVPPPRHFPVEKVEHEPREWECKSRPQVIVIFGQEVPGGGEYGERATETIHNGDKISQPEIPKTQCDILSAQVSRANKMSKAYLTSEKCPSSSLYCCNTAASLSDLGGKAFLAAFLWLITGWKEEDGSKERCCTLRLQINCVSRGFITCTQHRSVVSHEIP